MSASSKGTDEAKAVKEVFHLANGVQRTQVLGAVARLGVADVVADTGYTSVAHIAEAVAAHEEYLYRLLRCAADIGVFEESPSGRAFAMTPTAAVLKRDHPSQVGAVAAMMAMPGHYQAWGRLYESVKTGKPGVQLAHGADYFTFLSDGQTEEFEVFDRAMTAFTAAAAQSTVEAHNWGQYETIVDVGGGHGALAAALLRATPGLKGVVLELPQVVAAAPPVPKDLGHRLTYTRGDFFKGVPVASDCYVMKHVLHDWNDEECVTILKNTMASLKPGGEIVVVESVLPSPGEGTDPFGVAWKDVNMMAMTTGKERTAAEWKALMATAGQELEGIHPFEKEPYSVLVAKAGG